MVTYKGANYYYLRNLQNDVIGLLNSSGTAVVSYIYDTWGKPISTTGSLSSTLGQANPFRYRGYIYDTETGLYYLGSRYYNPEIGRMLNSDIIIGGVGTLFEHNTFAYAQNDPVNNADPTGFWVDTALDIISIGVSIADVASNPRDPWNWVALTADVVCLVLPVAAGGGLAVKAAVKGIDAVQGAKRIAQGAEITDTVADTGIVYLRTDLKTGTQYVGQSKSEARYAARKLEHARAKRDAVFEFEELARAKPGIDLDIAEQKK